MTNFVQIVESPSPADLANGRSEGVGLREMFRLSGTPHDYRLAVNKVEFRRVFDVTEPTNRIRHLIEEGISPILHLSMHGNETGIQLTDGSIIEWEELRHILTPLNNQMPLGLMVAFSTCGGAASIRMSMHEGDDEKPFYATVGSFDEVHWDDALVAFTTFYHNWLKVGLTIEECVDRMRIASGHKGFAAYSGAQQKQNYKAYVSNRRLLEALTGDLRPSNAPANTLGPLFGLQAAPR